MAALRPFVFYRDAAFWLGCAAYASNRFWLLHAFDSPFLQAYANDLWLIPCALPPVLWVHDVMGWRDGGPPAASEIVAHLAGWSVLFEALGPYFLPSATGDVWDVACYWAGGLAAWLWWNRATLLRTPQ